MAQTRRHSLAEVISNQLAGYFLAVGTQMLIYPFYGLEVKVGQNMQIAAIFTVVSVARNYVFRRAWNRLSR